MEYLDNGGNMILADDFGYGNSFIDKIRNYGYPYYFGFDEENLYEFAGEQVIDIKYKDDPDYPLVTTDTAQKFDLMLNEPTGFVEVTDYDYYNPYYSDNLEVLASTSSQSWLDNNGNYSRDTGETGGPFPVILQYSTKRDSYYGGGSFAGSTLIMISDPSMFINDMWDQADNREFALYLIDQMVQYGGEVIFDESVHINENYAFETPNGFYSFVIFCVHNFFIFLFIEMGLFTALFVGVASKRNKIKYQRHKDNLDMKKIFQMNKPALDNYDHFWIRDVLLYKIRVGYDIEAKTFNSFNRDQIKTLVDDNELSDFIYNIPRLSRSEVAGVVHSIIEWTPKKKLLKVAEEMVLDAVIIQDDEKNDKKIKFDNK